MISRFAQKITPQEIRALLKNDNVAISEPDENEVSTFKPASLFKPTNKAIIIVQNDSGTSYKAVTMRWGIVPQSAKSTTDGPLYVAKAESVSEGTWPWQAVRHNQRCILACEGYYQTKATGNIKNWYFIRRKDKGLLYLAALYYGDGELNAFAIITTNACEVLQDLHHEQAVILQPGAVFQWLDASDPEWTPAHDSAILDPYNNGSTPIESYLVGDPHIARKNFNPMTPKQRQMGIEEAFARQTPKRSQPLRAKGPRSGREYFIEPQTPTKGGRGSHRTSVKHILLTPRPIQKRVSSSSRKGKQRQVEISSSESGSGSEDELPEPSTSASGSGKARGVVAGPIVVSSGNELDEEPPASRDATPVTSPEKTKDLEKCSR